MTARMRGTRFGLLAALVWAFPLSPAHAQGLNLDALAGAWSFETAPHHITGCVIHGDVQAARRGAALRMDIKAHATCPDGLNVEAQERCTGVLQDERLQIACTLVEPADGYVADQFTLQVINSALMSGRLYDSGIWNDDVVWRRGAALVS